MKAHSVYISKEKYSHAYRILLVVILFIGLNLYSKIVAVGDQQYMYDSYYYWIVGDVLWDGFRFDITAFPETFRGCWLCIILSFFKLIIPGPWAWRILANAMIALEFVCILPFLFDKRKGIYKYIGIVASLFLYVYFFGNAMQYPISDFPALFFMSVGLCLLKLANGCEKNKLIWFAAGMTLYITYNIRVVYLYGIVVAVIYYVFKKKRNRISVILMLFIILFGAGLAATPQMLINYKYIDEFTPIVQTSEYNEYERSLETQQIIWGISNDRAEGYIGDKTLYPSELLAYLDVAGNEIVARENVANKSFPIGTYLKLWISYPLDLIALYTRHIISLSIPLYRDVYIKDLMVNKSGTICVSLLILMICWLDIMRKWSIKQLVLNINTISLCVPCFLEAAGAPEIRFFLPIYVMLYWTVGSEIDYKEWAKWCYNHKALVLTTIVAAILALTIISSILGNCDGKVLLINDKTLN